MKLNNFKHIFLDRDGIINKIIIREGIISSPRSLKEFKFRKDFLDFVKKIDKNMNFYLVTNQPDIKRKFLKKDILEKMHKKINQYLIFKDILVCEHDNKDFCDCRKPKPGMINKIINKYNLNRKDCLLIGDTKKDVEAAKAAQIESYLLNTNYNSSYFYKKKFNSLLNLI